METPPRNSAKSPFHKLMASPKHIFSKTDPALAKALELLNLYGLEDLEEKFLKLDAFIVPWAYFRDHFLLLQPSGMPRSSLPGRISRENILHWYSQYDEGKLRYDPTADIESDFWEEDKSKRGVIQKFVWGVEEYEKFLYAWLLQAFKVGKIKNVYGFKHFELKNVAYAWEEVFVPIVNAVRNDYDIRGRRHYGRLALYIENVSPSRLAFPSANVRVVSESPSKASSTTSSPQGTVRQYIYDDNHKPHPVTNLFRAQKPPVDDGLSPELRSTAAQYGGLVERPKNKQSLKDWLAKKRQEADHRKALSALEGSSLSFSTPHPRAYAGGGVPAYPASTKRTPLPSPSSPPATPTREHFNLGISRSLSSPTSRSLTNAFSQGSDSGSPEQDIVSPLASPSSQTSDKSQHRQFRYGDGLHRSNTVDGSTSAPMDDYAASFKFPSDTKEEMQMREQKNYRDTRGLSTPVTMKALKKARREFSFYLADKESEDFDVGDGQYMQTTVAGVSPYATGSSPPAVPEKDTPAHLARSRVPVGGKDSPARPFGSRVPVGEKDSPAHPVGSRVPIIGQAPSSRAYRERSPFPPAAPAIHQEDVHPAFRVPVPERSAPTHPVGSRIPVPGQPSSSRTYRERSAYPPSAPAIDEEEIEMEPIPPLPARNPRRMYSQREPSQGDRLGQRIISRENIRAALGNLTDDEDEEGKKEEQKVGAGDSQVSRGESSKGQLRTYNTHMFPRKGQ